MALSVSLTQTLAAAFPAALLEDVLAVIRILPEDGSVHSSHIDLVQVRGEPLHIPARIYFDEPRLAAIATLSERQRAILHCLYTRHHNGFVREKHLRMLIDSREAFVPPFVLQLLGEYVIEIQEFLAQNLYTLKEEPYTSFIAENPVFMEKTRQRILSYWDCYHRGAAHRYELHVGYRVWMAICGGEVPRRARR